MKNFARKLKHVNPLLAITAAAFILALATAVIPNNQVKTDIKGAQTLVKRELVKPSVAPTKAIDSNSKVLDNPPAGGPTTTLTPQKSSNSNQNSTSQSNQNSNSQPTSPPAGGSEPTSAPQATTAPVQNIQVTLSINGSSAGTVTLANGQNQCDVLSNALSQGKISQLNMKWENSLGTYGIYQINGQGKENTVWWVYKINGASPSQGCSYVKANSGDNVEWNYIGS